MSKVQELKKVMKPIIKECIKEILYEEGLMRIVQENVQNTAPIRDTSPAKQNYELKERQFIQKNTPTPQISIQERKNKLLEEIRMPGFDPFSGVDLTAEEQESAEMHEETDKNKIYEGIQGSGVDISRLMNVNKQSWNLLNSAMGNSKKE